MCWFKQVLQLECDKGPQVITETDKHAVNLHVSTNTFEKKNRRFTLVLCNIYHSTNYVKPEFVYLHCLTFFVAFV